MAGTIRLISSGFPLIDQKWGGIYRGGTYLLIGPRKSGRTLTGLQFAMESAKDSEVCLYFTNMRPKDLMIQAATINFDIQSYMNQNLIIVVRVAPPNDVYEMGSPDEFLVEYLNDIITVINQYNPSRIIFDELTQYIGFKNIDLLRDVFLQTIETIEEKDISSLFILGEPATETAQNIVDTIAEFVTGVIYLKKEVKKINGQYHGGKAVITPNVGHAEGQFSATYTIQPFKGVTVEEDRVSSFGQRASASSAKLDVTNEPENDRSKDDLVQNVQMPSYDSQATKYDYADFQLILNNQIALYKSTGQKFNLLSFKLDPAANVKGLLTVNQLDNAISSAADKKDKVCMVDNKIMVLIIRSSKASAINLIERIKNFLPSRDINYIETTVKFISIMNVEVDERVENAEGMLKYVLREEPHGDQYYEPLKKYTD